MMSGHAASAPSAGLDFPLGKAERPGVGYAVPTCADRHGSSALRLVSLTPPSSIDLKYVE